MSLIEHLSDRVTVCYGPEMEVTHRESMGVKWCFKCRKRHEFEWVVMMPVIDLADEASIYAAAWGPTAFSQCGGCGAHGSDLFPGWSYGEVDK